jgi:glycosyltransferase involved in cell wall biosynthesis
MWVCQQPTPYNDTLFSAIAGSDVELLVSYIDAWRPTHPWKSVDRQYNWRAYKRFAGIDWHVIRTMCSRKTFVVLGGWHEPTVQLAIVLGFLLRRPFAIWTDMPKDRPRSLAKKAARNAFLWFTFKATSVFFATGIPARDVLVSLGCPRERIKNLPYFIDLNAFSPSSLPSSEHREIIFLSSGRLVNWIKAHDLAILALAQVSRRFPHIPLRYRLAGTGPDEAMLRNLAREQGIDVDFVGWLEPEELPNFYRSGDVLLHPSHEDAFASSVLEAMACGRPVIGSDVTGAILDRVTHGVEGLRHKPGDLAGIAAQVEWVVSHRDQLAEMGKRAHQAASLWPVERGVRTVLSVASGDLSDSGYAD